METHSLVSLPPQVSGGTRLKEVRSGSEKEREA